MRTRGWTRATMPWEGYAKAAKTLTGAMKELGYKP